jgi:hypothetical protein
MKTKLIILLALVRLTAPAQITDPVEQQTLDIAVRAGAMIAYDIQRTHPQWWATNSPAVIGDTVLRCAHDVMDKGMKPSEAIKKETAK